MYFRALSYSLTATETATNTATATPTDTPTNTPTDTATATNTPADTATPELGRLEVCNAAGPGVSKGDVFTISVNSIPYSAPAGSCFLAGQFPLDTQVTLQETIPAGFFASNLTVAPSSQLASLNTASGQIVVSIGSGVTEVTYTNGNSTSTSTETPEPNPSEAFVQICKQAEGDGVTGFFNFRSGTDSRSVPVGACTSLIFTVSPGNLIIKKTRAQDSRSQIFTRFPRIG